MIVIIEMIMAEAGTGDNLGNLVGGLFEEHRSAVFAYVYRLVGNREWAEELTQAAFLRVYDARARLPEVRNRRAWIYRIATNTAFNALKRWRRFLWLPWHEADVAPLGRSDSAEQVEGQTLVEQALLALAPKYRAPLLLYSHYGFSVGEVAEALGIGEGAVKMRLSRAREMFRGAYQRESCR